MGASSHMMMFSEQLNICLHTATATANTLTTQYMVRFSHLTVQLPEMRLFHILNKQVNMILKNVIAIDKCNRVRGLKNIRAIKKKIFDT